MKWDLGLALIKSASQRNMKNMKDDKHFSEAALRFVDLLTPGNFVLAKDWISPDCKYLYGEKVLTGDSIIQSFIANHDEASSKLDKIEYLDSEVESIEGQTVSVIVRDKIYVQNSTHEYKDRLIITFGDHTGEHSITQIENRRVTGEREKLLKFFDSLGMEWT